MTTSSFIAGQNTVYSTNMALQVSGMTRKKWGAGNKDGKMVIPFKYDRLSMFSEGLAVVRKGNETYIIN